jgi:hypothetical protein
MPKNPEDVFYYHTAGELFLDFVSNLLGWLQTLKGTIPIEGLSPRSG